MSARVIKSPDARRGVFEIGDRIAHDSLDAALRFLAAAEQTFDFLARNPHFGAPVPTRRANLRSLRRWPVQGFPNHIVFFRAVRGGVEIVRVLHGARDLPNVLGLND